MHEIGLEGRFIQIGVEIIKQCLERRLVVIVADRIARLFPNMFLGVQFRASRREVHQFQARVLDPHFVQGRAMMPGCPIQHQ